MPAGDDHWPFSPGSGSRITFQRPHPLCNLRIPLLSSFMSATRIEKDSMGTMEVPADALYGASTQRAVLNFPISGYRFGREFIRALAMIKWAAAEANLELGRLDKRRAG